MHRIQPFPVAVALSFILLILFSVCVLLHLVFSTTAWPMVKFWEVILVGFSWVSTLSYFVAVLEIFVIAFYVAYVFVSLYNFFNDRFPAKEEEAMKPLRFKPVAFAITGLGIITYILCFLFDLVFPAMSMVAIWEIVLPGFKGLDLKSFFIGLIDVTLYGIYIAAVFVPLYNNFYSTELPEVK
ncbi:MAG: DUF5676 family membrane protein [candidate division KSB1 bacterium]|nr:DUF5676 family membrane protein [candidate division KSB1 bacterium]